MFHLLGVFAAGVIVGGLLIDVNLRAPAPIKAWLSRLFSRGEASADDKDGQASGQAKG